MDARGGLEPLLAVFAIDPPSVGVGAVTMEGVHRFDHVAGCALFFGCIAGDGEDTFAQNICHGMSDQGRIAIIRDQRRQRIAQTEASVGGGQHKTPASELAWPPSNAAVTFFLQMFGSEKGSSVSSKVAGTADSARGLRRASTLNL